MNEAKGPFSNCPFKNSFCLSCLSLCILVSCRAENSVYLYDTRTKTVKTKVWSHLPNCTSALRWLEHYYCFNGHNFTRFHPVTGAVVGTYPKDARKYFMRCPNLGEHWWSGGMHEKGAVNSMMKSIYHFFSFVTSKQQCCI